MKMLPNVSRVVLSILFLCSMCGFCRGEKETQEQITNALSAIKNRTKAKFVQGLASIKEEINSIEARRDKILCFHRAFRALDIIDARLADASDHIDLSDKATILGLCQALYEKRAQYTGSEDLKEKIVRNTHALRQNLDREERTLTRLQKKESIQLGLTLQILENNLDKLKESKKKKPELDELIVDLQLDFEENNVNKLADGLKWFAGKLDAPGDKAKAIAACVASAIAGFDVIWMNVDVQKTFLLLCKQVVDKLGAVDQIIDFLSLFCDKARGFARLELIVKNGSQGLLLDVIAALLPESAQKETLRQVLITIFSHFSSEQILEKIVQKKEIRDEQKILDLNIKLLSLEVPDLESASMRVFDSFFKHDAALKKELAALGIQLCFYPRFPVSDLFTIVSCLLTENLKEVVISDEHNKKLLSLFLKIYQQKQEPDFAKIVEVIKEKMPIFSVVSIFSQKMQKKEILDSHVPEQLLLLCFFISQEELLPQLIRPIVEFFATEDNFDLLKTDGARLVLLTLCHLLVKAGVAAFEVSNLVKYFDAWAAKEGQELLLDICIMIVNSTDGEIQEDVESALNRFLGIGDSEKTITDAQELKRLLDVCDRLFKNDAGKRKVMHILKKIADSGVLTVDAGIEVQKKLLSLSHGLLDRFGEDISKGAMGVCVKVLGAFEDSGILSIEVDSDIHKQVLRLCERVLVSDTGKTVVTEVLVRLADPEILSDHADTHICIRLIKLSQALLDSVDDDQMEEVITVCEKIIESLECLEILSTKVNAEIFEQVLRLSERLITYDGGFDAVIQVLGVCAQPGFLTTKTDIAVRKRVLALGNNLLDSFGETKPEEAIVVCTNLLSALEKAGILSAKIDDDARKQILSLCEHVLTHDGGQTVVIQVLTQFAQPEVLSAQICKSVLRLCHALLDNFGDDQAEEISSVCTKVLEALANSNILSAKMDSDMCGLVLDLCEHVLTSDAGKAAVTQVLTKCADSGFLTAGTDVQIQKDLLRLTYALLDDQEAISVCAKVLGAFAGSGMLSAKIDAQVQKDILILCEKLVRANKNKEAVIAVLNLLSDKERLDDIVTENDKKIFLYLIATLHEDVNFTQELAGFFTHITCKHELVDEASRSYLITLLIKFCVKLSAQREWKLVQDIFDCLTVSALSGLMQEKAPDEYNAFYVQFLDMYIKVLDCVLHDWRETYILKWFFGQTPQAKQLRDDLLEKLGKQAPEFISFFQSNLKDKKYFQTKETQAVILDWCDKLLEIKDFDSRLVTPIAQELASGGYDESIVKRVVSLKDKVSENIK